MTKKEFREALEDILGVPRGALRDSDTRETIPTWDSVADVQLVLFIQSNYACEAEAEAELLEAESVGQLLYVLERQNIFPETASEQETLRD
jgi:acyl carrier protein